MKSVRVRSDFTVKLPEELRTHIQPGDSLEVVVAGRNVTYRRRGRRAGPSLREIIERVRCIPPERVPSEAEIEEIIHEVRRERR